MAYFITGATGFIGRHLVEALLEREGTLYVLVRAGSRRRLAERCREWGVGEDRVVPIDGDLTRPQCGVTDADVARLRGQVRHFFHLAAVYDMAADAEALTVANVAGTMHALQLAHAVEAGCFHHASSIAAAGLYEGVFREDMFAEAERVDAHPYFATKHESEAIVRRECRVPWRVYRPGMVVGHSRTGVVDKIDGPYYFFKPIQKLRRTLPPWMPTIGIEGGRVHLVPVDFVARAMDHIAHQPDLDGRAFHLVDPEPRRIGEVINLFARAAHAPQMALRLNTRMFAFIPDVVRHGLWSLPPVKRIVNDLLDDLGVPRQVLRFVNYPTRFDCRDATAALAGSGIAVPPLEDYAWRLWDYWERHLDPDLFAEHTLEERVRDRVVLITGASSGIGRAAALRVAAAGAKAILVARNLDKLDETRRAIEADGGRAWSYPCDVADMADCDRLVADVERDHGAVDVLINNAGRSIRRSIALSFDRFHDYERCMQLNYFGALRLVMGFLPRMIERRRGHVVNVSSIGVLSNAPRFSAYVASKAALDAFSRCAAAEFSDSNITFTTINMPLVRTPMIAPTKLYQNLPAISPEEAADMIADAIVQRPKRIATRLGVFAQAVNALFPKLAETVMNTAFRLFPESAAAKGVRGVEERASDEQVAFANLMRGIHW